jgi:ArsR family transcriptional regulator
MNDDIFELHAKLCQVFASEKRLRIMWALADGEMSVGDLARELESNPSNISQHLRIMRDMHVVDSRRDGQTTYYSLRNRKFFKGAQQIRAALMQEFGRMTNVVNQEEKSG